MPDVTLPAGDVETLLFAVGAIKQIEAYTTQRSGDPLVPDRKGNLTLAVERAERAWRAALRAENPDFAMSQRPVTPADGGTLAALGFWNISTSSLVGGPVPVPGGPVVFQIAQLQSAGLVERGVARTGITWSDSGETTVTQSAVQWMRLRPRGTMAIRMWQEWLHGAREAATAGDDAGCAGGEGGDAGPAEGGSGAANGDR
jgi:hypothetical protein